MFRIDVKRDCESAIERLIAMELIFCLGALRYGRGVAEEKNHRIGAIREVLQRHG